MNDIVVFENLRFQRFPESPLRRVFLKRCVFRDRFHRIRVDGTSNRWKKNLRFQIRKDTCGRGPAVCQLKSEWFPSYLLIPRKKMNNFFHHTSQECNWTQHFRTDHNVLCHSLPPKFCKTIGTTAISRRNWKQRLCQIWGDKQGALFVHVKMVNIRVAIS